jgi:hypothetical protein
LVRGEDLGEAMFEFTCVKVSPGGVEQHARRVQDQLLPLPTDLGVIVTIAEYRGDHLVLLDPSMLCVYASPQPVEPAPIPRNESFDDWLKRTADLLEECQKEKR